SRAIPIALQWSLALADRRRQSRRWACRQSLQLLPIYALLPAPKLGWPQTLTRGSIFVYEQRFRIGARGLCQSLRAKPFLTCILTRRLRNSHAEAAMFLLSARMAKLGEAPESRMSKALLIAIVEDDWLFRDSMRSLMKSLGYTVEGFSSATDFLA